MKAFAELWLNRMIALERLIGGGFAVRVLLVASSLVITLAATSQSPFAQSSNPEEFSRASDHAVADAGRNVGCNRGSG